MLWGGHANIANNDIHQEHIHDMHELVVCMSEHGQHRIGEQLYDFVPGRTFLLPGGVWHKVVVGDVPAEIIFVCFDQESLVEHTTLALQQIVRRMIEQEQFVCPVVPQICKENLRLALKLHSELRSTEPLSQSMAGCLLCELLINHSRSIRSEVPENTGAAPLAIAAVCREIAGNPAQDLSVDGAARRAGMSRALFTRNFRQYTGMTWTEYVRSVRISRAMKLMTETDLEILDVALESGFGNLGYFYRCFKQCAGTTPKAFRKQIRRTGQPVPNMSGNVTR